MTGAETLSYIKQNFKRTDKDAEIYLAVADTIMDMRSRMLSDEFSYTATTPSGTLSVGDYKLSVPADFGHLVGDITIRDSETDTVYNPAKRISKEEYDEIYSQNLSTTASKRLTGVPLNYCFFGREIWLGPAVDKTTYEFTINYTTEDAPVISGATSVVQFTDQFREVVRAGTLYRMFFELGFTQEAANWMGVYEAGIERIINNDLFNSGSSTVGVQYGGF
jgi:hypothetical protein